MASEVNFSKLISIDANGLHIASFADILNYLTIRYKEAYGDNIKIDNASADGIFLYDTALEINNVLQTINAMYANFNVNEATGTALDNLCSLSNIFRKTATKSVVTVEITNEGSSDISLPDGIIAVDKAGINWMNENAISLIAGTPKEIQLECEDTGYIVAEPNWIYQIINLPNNVVVSISQPNAAIPGQEAETDEELRARKNESNSPLGMTVLDSLVGALLDITGVRDAVVYNSVGAADATLDDNTTVEVHNIYVVIRYVDDALDQLIANTIYNKITPGVLTTAYDDTQSNPTGTSKELAVYPSLYGMNNNLYGVQVRWKKALPANPTIAITFNQQSPLHFSKEFAEDIIGKGLIEYLNGLQIATGLTRDDLKVQAYALDPRYSGPYDFNITGITIGGSNNDYTNKYQYYNYSSASYASNVLTIS